MKNILKLLPKIGLGIIFAIMAIISIASTKGGVGKTSLAFSLAKDLRYRYATNDMSVVLNKYKNASILCPQVPYNLK